MEIRGSGVAAADGGLGGRLGVWRSADGTLKEVECESLNVSYQNIKGALGDSSKKPVFPSPTVHPKPLIFLNFFTQPSRAHLLNLQQLLESSLGLRMVSMCNNAT